MAPQQTERPLPFELDLAYEELVQITGGNGNDTLFGGAGNDTIQLAGAAFSSTIWGGSDSATSTDGEPSIDSGVPEPTGPGRPTKYSARTAPGARRVSPLRSVCTEAAGPFTAVGLSATFRA